MDLSRRLSVTVYDAAGSVVRDRSGGAAQVYDLRFSTGVPGGFRDATFTARLPSARLWPVDTGQTLVIRRGSTTVWWGWVEDVRRRLRGQMVEAQVTALGPYQTLTQRLIETVDYDEYLQSSAALRQELLANCDEISGNYSGIQSTGVVIGPMEKAWWPVSDLARTVSDAGNADGQQMLFAVWEPSTVINATEALHARNILQNPDMEDEDWYGWTVHAYTNGDTEVITDNYVSPTRSRKSFSTSAVASGSLKLRNANLAASPSTLYQFDYWYYFPALSGLTAQVSVLWLDAGSGDLGTTSGTLHSSTGTAGWNYGVAQMTSPVGTATCIAYLNATWGAGTDRYVLWDDCYLSEMTTAQVRDGKPRAYLWPRDLSGYEYLLHTGRSSGIDINETTRELANYVVASYGSANYTAAAADTTSQGLYRRRDRLVAAGAEAGASLAGQIRDATLERYASPADEAPSFRLRQEDRALTNRYGLPVHLEDVRAGDRLRLADGPQAGLIVLAESTEYRDGVLQITPENRPDVPLLLARR